MAPCMGSSIRGPFTAARSKPDIIAESNNFCVTWCYYITAATFIALVSSSLSIFACFFSSNFGRISSPMRVYKTWKKDFSLGENLLMRRLEPSLFGPKQEV